MQKLKKEDIKIDSSYEIKEGSFGKVRRCNYGNSKYILKTFNDISYLKGKKRKLDLLSDIDIKGLYTPKYWVENNSYISKIAKGYDLDSIKDKYSKEKQLLILKNCKKLIEKMHEENIIHSDLSFSNILVNNDSISIIDFDNASFDKYKTNIKDANDFCIEYIKKYGINKELDIFMFNLLSYSVVNNCNIFFIRKNLMMNNYRYFDNKDGRKICDSLFLDGKYKNKDYLIDTIDETCFKI